ncbi:MAG TPA: hypothetical protein VL156_03470 [Terriglobales bacterium]|jgi:hypothetical protein|nr:hypothetical protein [Terriglobales bacterium]
MMNCAIPVFRLVATRHVDETFGKELLTSVPEMARIVARVFLMFDPVHSVVQMF